MTNDRVTEMHELGTILVKLGLPVSRVVSLIRTMGHEEAMHGPEGLVTAIASHQGKVARELVDRFGKLAGEHIECFTPEVMSFYETIEKAQTIDIEGLQKYLGEMN
ncbi:hypothetical protein C5Y93_19770 [Blastopirellula marina]|uniref:Uncharacterized protein n=2 Tax=Blastopirellula marina TaxID=124 RepID=A0A2S8GIF0_9BACT|nr:hypothetical protein C5Y93_19770 [Blastopirellula marina]